jgi:hypothetical protein
MIGNIKHFVAHSKRGERVVYHAGFLMKDRMESAEVDALADQAMSAQVAGEVVLLQRRIGFWDYDYIAVRT